MWINVKLKLDGQTRHVKIGRGVRQGCCSLPSLFNLYTEQLTKEAPEGFGDFKIKKTSNSHCEICR